MDYITTLLDWAGYPATVLVIVASIVALYRWVRGITPALLRLGKGLASRKIAVFASGDDYSALKSMLLDSGLFKEKNICQITKNECKKAEGYSLFLVHWKSASAHFDEVLSAKKDATALIVYAPQEEGFLSEDAILKLNKERNAILVNMRGRLLNDIVSSLITTSYEKN